MRPYLKLKFLFVLSFLAVRSFSQTNPVTVNAQLLPPYSVYLSDYVNPESDKLFVSLMFNDLNKPTYDVKLRITIEGVGIKLETKPDAQLPAITVNSGILERLGAVELMPYFDANNILFQGLTKQQFQKNAALPEGLYKFCIQAFDYNKNIAVSNKACTSAWLILNDPPRINAPICASTVKVIYPQNVVFQWTPMHLNSPNSAFTTDYHFRLVQIIPAGRNPNDAMLSSVPVFEAITNNSSLYYGISEPTLIPGQQYAWRVQAKDGSGKDLFKNGGYSEVCMFTYGEPCMPPKNIKVEVNNSRKATVSWNQGYGPSKYIVRYREKGNSNASWYSNESFTNSSEITGLKDGLHYEFEVQSICDPVESPYSERDTFSIRPVPGAKDCNPVSQTASIDKSSQLESLKANDVIDVDGFKVRIISATGSNGVFTGKGVAYIPFMDRYLKMSFNGIKVNSTYQVYEGKVIADRANLEKYRARVPSAILKNDICQDINEQPKDTKNSSKGKGETKGETVQDSIKVITINGGDIKVKEGDIITVNGKQIVVTKDTEIKPGDVVSVNGKTARVNSVESKNVATNPSAPPEFKLKVQDALIAMRDEKYDSLVNLKSGFISTLNQFKNSNKSSVTEFGTGNKTPLDVDTSSARSLKPLRVTDSSPLSSEQKEYIKKKKLLLSLYGTVAAANEVLRKENVETFSADVYKATEDKGKVSDRELKKIIESLVIKYKEENFNK